MRNGLLGSIAALVTGAGVAFGQTAPTQGQAPLPLPPAGQTPQSVASPGAGSPSAAGTPSASPGSAMPMPGQVLWANPADYSGNGERVLGDSDYGPGPCPYRFWADADLLLWWVKPGPSAIPLLTTGTESSLGIIGRNGTKVLTEDSFDFGLHAGGRFIFGGWIDRGGHIGVEAGGFFLEQNSTGDNVSSNTFGQPLLSRPVINAQTDQEAVFGISVPGALSGHAIVNATEELYGAEVNFVGSLYRSQHFVADMVIGFRYLGLTESLDVGSSSNVLLAGTAAFNGQLLDAGSQLAVLDHFQTRNDFYGGQIGARAQLRGCRMYAELRGSLAVGNTHETLEVTGATAAAGSGVDGALPGGLLAVASNFGLRTHDEFAFVPEASVKVGFHVNNYITASVGYSFLYWFDVARPGVDLDRVVNPSLVPSNLSFGEQVGPQRPLATINRTDYWAQGINLGLEIRY